MVGRLAVVVVSSVVTGMETVYGGTGVDSSKGLASILVGGLTSPKPYSIPKKISFSI